VTDESYHGASDYSSAARAAGADLTQLTPPGASAGRSVYEPPRETPVHAVTEVLVVGGGPAGCAAALAARRLGADVVLVERYNHLGGLSTGGLVIWIDRMTDWSGRRVITGIGSELLERLPAEAIAGAPEELWGSTDERSAAHWRERQGRFAAS
jgi:NADPH-dependent 2,4-dienoyl-CoA reductase/sulfur reductase-like enzyme